MAEASRLWLDSGLLLLLLLLWLMLNRHWRHGWGNKALLLAVLTILRLSGKASILLLKRRLLRVARLLWLLEAGGLCAHGECSRWL